MKKNTLKPVLFAILLVFGGLLNAIPADVDVYFNPENSFEVLTKRSNLLKTARESILVAGYAITDQLFINELIDFKQRGIDVQIIFDVTMPNFEEVMNYLISKNIVPIISSFVNKPMHNKFIVIDNTDVLTGSANFSWAAFRPGKRGNDENIVILKSEEIAKKYKNNFYNIESGIFAAYIQQIADESLSQIQEWVKVLASELYKKNDNFKNDVRRAFDQANAMQKNRLIAFFSDLASGQSASSAQSSYQAPRLASAVQLAELGNAGVLIIPGGLTYNEAWDLIDKLRSEKNEPQSKKRKLDE